MVRILRERQPVAFVAENVKGILSANNHEAFPLIIKEFEEAGYVVNHKLCFAADFGVPQKRERVFIVGIRADQGFQYEFSEAPIRSEQDYVSISKILEEKIEDKYFFSEKAVQGMLKSRTSKTMNKGRAQDINKPSNTVSSHLAKVSLNSTDPVLLINGKYRRYTPREVARIQSFPEEYKLIGSEGAQYRMLGNAIPPVMMWHIANRLLYMLRNKDQFIYEFPIPKKYEQTSLFDDDIKVSSIS